MPYPMNRPPTVQGFTPPVHSQLHTWATGWGTPANVEMCVGEVIPVWQSVIHAEQAFRQCKGVGTVVVLIMFQWSSLAHPCPKSIIKCTYPAKK